MIEDIVTYDFSGKSGIGEIINLTSKKAELYDIEEESYITVPKTCITKLPDVILNADTYAKFARYEITISDVVNISKYQTIVNADNYKITSEDLLCVLKKIVSEEISSDIFYEEWLYYFQDILHKLNFENQDNRFYNENTVIENISGYFDDWTFISDENQFDSLIKQTEEFIEDKTKPILNRRFPDWAKIKLLSMLQKDSELNSASEEEVTLYKRFAEELCEKDNLVALEAVGYGYYGGNRAFSCDWKKSEECMLRLFHLVDILPKKAFYANTLGYIYYYGRTTNSVPDYEKAYKYFSFAAFNKIYEAEYKIADMYTNGYGVIKSPQTAENIITELYNENIKYIHNGHFSTKLADIAFRMGNFRKDKYNIYESDFYDMLYYYYIARFAIKMRMKTNNFYGDTSVAAAIDKAIAETKEQMEYQPLNKISLFTLVGLFSDYFRNGEKLDVKVTQLSSGNYRLVFKTHKTHNDKYPKKLFLAFPLLDMCGMYDSLSVIVSVNEDSEIEFSENMFTVDDIDSEYFFFNDKPVAKFCYCDFIIKKPKTNSELHRLISVRFGNNDKSYDYLCDNTEIKIGDLVTVDANGEKTQAVVTDIFEKAENELALPLNVYKKI